MHRRLTGEGWYTKLATERHYTPEQVAAARGLSDTTVRRMFQEKGGVLRVGEPSRRTGRKLTRRMYTIRIPETVARRVLDGITSPTGGPQVWSGRALRRSAGVMSELPTTR